MTTESFASNLEVFKDLAISHSLIVLSSDPDAICLPSGENATVETPPEWPANVF
jgi:hypothetical protein